MSFLVKQVIMRVTNTSGPRDANPPANIKMLNDSVWEFCSPERPDVDILFFHGLQLGDFEDAFWKTWLAKNDEEKVWPKDWLSKKLPHARIFSLSYNSSATRPEGEPDNFWIKNLGENLVSDIILHRANIGQNGPVFLVGHSLGGLVIKQFILSAKKQFGLYRPDGNCQGSRDKISTFLDHLRGVFYYATPHEGSDLADDKLPELAVKLLGTSPILELLQTLDTQRGRINSSFENQRKNLKDLRTYAVVEGLDTTFKGFSARVVPRASAVRDVDEQYIHNRGDHFTVCKARDENDPTVIGKLVDFILGSVPKGSIVSEDVDLLE